MTLKCQIKVIGLNLLDHACVANTGKMIHDCVGKYVLPSNHSVLVLSDRCQLVVMGKHASACGGRDSRRHVLRWGSMIGPRSAGRLGTGERESLVVTSAVGIVDFEREVLCKKCIRL